MFVVTVFAMPVIVTVVAVSIGIVGAAVEAYSDAGHRYGNEAFSLAGRHSFWSTTKVLELYR